MTDDSKTRDKKRTEDQQPQDGNEDTNGGGTQMAAELQQMLEEAKATAEMCRDQLLRKAAEFENYKRRVEIDQVNFVKTANESLLGLLLPVLDDLSRSLKSGKEQKNFDAFYKGVELIQNKFTQVLEGQGLTAFDSLGKPFDVDLHDALLQVPREDVPPGTVVEEVERGYKLYDRVLRHAKVVVSAEPMNSDEPKTRDRNDHR
jgi:molecular chaperone GrpE